jgi:hypothetical protein
MEGRRWPSWTLADIAAEPLSREKLAFIVDWATSVSAQMSREQVAALFRSEGLFREDSTEYWLPVQSQLIPYMKEELRVGDEVTLYLVWIGALKSSSAELDRVFLVNNFPAAP